MSVPRVSFPASVKKVHQANTSNAGTTGAPARSQRRGAFHGNMRAKPSPKMPKGKMCE